MIAFQPKGEIYRVHGGVDGLLPANGGGSLSLSRRYPPGRVPPELIEGPALLGMIREIGQREAECRGRLDWTVPALLAGLLQRIERFVAQLGVGEGWHGEEIGGGGVALKAGSA